MDGSIETAIVRPKGYSLQTDKIKFLVQELKHFHVSTVRLVMMFMKWMDLLCFIQVAVSLSLVMLSSMVRELL